GRLAVPCSSDADRHMLGRAVDSARCGQFLPCRQSPVDGLERLAPDELAATGPRRGNAIAPDDLAARKRVTRQSGYLHALEDIVVDDRLLGRGRDCLARFRVPHHKVGVGAGYDGALAWVDVEDLRDVRG